MNVTHQQALFDVDVIIEVVKTVPSKDGDDNTWNYGNRSSQKNSLPLGPFDVEKSLMHKIIKEAQLKPTQVDAATYIHTAQYSP